MPSPLIPPLDALLIAMSVAFAVSVVVGFLIGRARVRHARRVGAPVMDVEAIGASSPLGADPTPSVPDPEPALLSRRWEPDRKPLLPRRGSRPG